MSKHTQGTWTTNQLAGSQLDTRIKAENKIIADCYSFSENILGEEAEANAQLIAAAPELLEALGTALLALEPLAKKTPEGWDRWACRSIYKKAKAAIAKAEGKEVKSHD